MASWSGPKDQQNKTGNFLSLTGTLYVLVNSRKDKGKGLKEHFLKDLVRRGFDARRALPVGNTVAANHHRP